MPLKTGRNMPLTNRAAGVSPVLLRGAYSSFCGSGVVFSGGRRAGDGLIMRFASQLSWTPYIYSTIIQYLNYGKTRYLTSMILDTDNHPTSLIIRYHTPQRMILQGIKNADLFHV